MNDDINQGLQEQIFDHIHDGNLTQRINGFDIFGNVRHAAQTSGGTIATTGNTDEYILVPFDSVVDSIDFSSLAALATSDTNFITWTITNLGQAGAGSAALLSTADTNTTKATGGSALAANTRRGLVLHATPNNLQVVQGDRLLIRATVTGTLANTVTRPVYIVRFR